jgi:hypothetical protein
MPHYDGSMTFEEMAAWLDAYGKDGTAAKLRAAGDTAGAYGVVEAYEAKVKADAEEARHARNAAAENARLREQLAEAEAEAGRLTHENGLLKGALAESEEELPDGVVEIRDKILKENA